MLRLYISCLLLFVLARSFGRLFRYTAMEQLSTVSEIAKSGLCYMRCDPPIVDFTRKYRGCFHFSGPSLSTSFTDKELNLDVRLATFYRVLAESVFSKGKTVLGWDMKQLFSYFMFHCKQSYRPPQANIIDLKYGLRYVGDRQTTQPLSFRDAAIASQKFVTYAPWKLVNRLVHVPLSTEVLPRMEVRKLAINNQVFYTQYEIEGQVSGRIKCVVPNANYLNVHSLDAEKRQSLRVLSADDKRRLVYVSLDFSHHEVSVLQWLSEDQQLGDALADSNSFYCSIIPFDLPDEQKHKLGKLCFMKILYGMQSNNLAESLKLNRSDADKVIATVKSRFPKAFAWIEEKQRLLADDPIAVDGFGRKRDFSNESPHVRRNFEVQSPAALVCLERLAALHRTLPDNLMFSIHDGYVLFSEVGNIRDVVASARSVLEAASPLCPGLKLSVACKVGVNLNDLKRVPDAPHSVC